MEENKLLKIAILLPSLDNKGSLIVAKDIVNNTKSIYPEFAEFEVFYFDDIKELKLDCKTTQINFKSVFLFKGFDVVHSHGFRSDKYLYKHRLFIKAKRISTIHCDVFEDLKYSYNFLVSKIFGQKWIKYLAYMDKVVCLTNTHKDFYAKYINKEKLTVISNGRLLDKEKISKDDLDFFETLRKKHKNKSIIASFAVLNKRKAIHQVIKAMPNLENHIFVIIGDGPERSKLEKLSTKLNVKNRCYFLGYKKDANRYMPLVDIFILPSLSEAFPLSLIEACYSGISSVCSNIPVLKEVYTKKEVTFFELGNTKSITEAIIRATEKKEELGSNAKKKTLSLYSMQSMIDNYKNLYIKTVS